ncbi:MAG: molybdopterin dehydrogenase, partial [Candidatus Rokuibacteriota bacterium]
AQLKGKAMAESAASLAEAGRIAGRAADAITDLHGSAEYKEHLVGVLLRRAWEQALKTIEESARR